MKIKKGDVVYITTGKERGLTGRVTNVIRKENRVIVEGRNIVKRHLKQGPQNQEGGILPREASMDASNVMLLSETTGKGVRVCSKFVGAEDQLFGTRAEAQKSFGEGEAQVKKVRYAPKTGERFE
jgi:large subunit ribosomal protein L24